MTNLEKIKKAQELLLEAHRILESTKFENEEKKEARKEGLSGINEVYKNLRNNFWSWNLEQVEYDIKNELRVNNLMRTYYDNEMYELEFHVGDKKYIVSNILEKDHPNAYSDEWYFENEEVLKEIMINANDEDIKEVE